MTATRLVRRLVEALGLQPRRLVLAAIRAYKRHVSPRKGFACAWRVHRGGASCSTLGYRAVSRHGVFRGLGILDRRLERCRAVHERQAGARRPAGALRAQAGFCDGCDAPSCDGPACDTPSCHAPSCDPAFCDGSACDGGGNLLQAGACCGPDDCDDCDDCGCSRDCRPWRRRRPRRGRRGKAAGTRPVPGPEGDA